MARNQTWVHPLVAKVAGHCPTCGRENRVMLKIGVCTQCLFTFFAWWST